MNKIETNIEMFKIAETREEKRENVLYWERTRIIAQNIRDEHDSVFENAYHAKFMKKINSQYLRPDFFEPLYTNKKSINLF